MRFTNERVVHLNGSGFEKRFFFGDLLEQLDLSKAESIIVQVSVFVIKL